VAPFNAADAWSVGRQDKVQSESFPIIAEIGATLAGFAAIAGVIRPDPVDRGE